MSIWPFKRRRRAKSDVSQEPRALSEKTQPSASAPHTPPPPRGRDVPPLPRRSSRRTDSRQNDAASSPRASKIDEYGARAAAFAAQDTRDSANKENAPPPQYHSKEDVTALPVQQRLERSPHLRPVDLEKPSIPYNFRPHSASQTSIQRHDALAKLTKSHTLRSKRSTTEYSSPSRRFSIVSKRDPVREEEIRAMATPLPIPKRPGDGPLRRDSKKMRSFIGASHVSLPPEGSIHSSMSGMSEQRGWEVGSIAAVFNPRPAVRLSALPQYVPSSLPSQTSGVLYRINSVNSPRDMASTNNKDIDAKERRKRRTIGKDADELGTSDLRAIMEREAKRKEKKQLERQERLERKLRGAGRERTDSERKRRNSEEQRRAEQTRARVEQELQARGVPTPPSEVHPALRDRAVDADSEPVPEPVGLGIAESEKPSEAARHPGHGQISETDDDAENPFVDAAESLPTTAPDTRDGPLDIHATTIESPFEVPYVGTAQAVRLSMAHTPPLSPIYSNRAPSSASQLTGLARLNTTSQQSVSDLGPPRIPEERRNSDQLSEKRTGTWASFFRRTSTFRRSSQQEHRAEGGSFSNASRESMRNQPLPAHLVGTDYPRPGTAQSRSGTPVRTQSKFREELPELPISPPDSRTQSPEVATAAAATAVARRAARATPVDIPAHTRDGESDVYTSGRTDTPVSAASRGHIAMSASLASIGSEGSWLASGGSKRQSNTSGLSRSLSKKNNEFSASYEELGGGDKDAEYFNRNRASRPASRANLIGASPDEESEEDGIAVEPTPKDPPLTVHGSVRRQPQLVEHDPRLVSRGGLVQEFAAQEPGVEAIETPEQITPEDEDVSQFRTPDHTDDEEQEQESPEVKRAIELGRARSVNMKHHSVRHSRQFSAGSARLLDMPPRGGSADMIRDATPSPLPQPNPLSRSHTPV
ncbi:hypothetical protein CERZMDRAFT_32222 [Cercospora zeae-maydis SCOH1-5]|uniref:Uncharacterized protein n=1 Tax=Cercospora zeae-maydis SCOH1-5 TaxID=717836 RepID=A0A6A6FUD2_9PEZI|nr:hypothetical protein CERZMDRAFT_32222 [Cercospora zeae-maydis SCOH1-5]